MELVQRYIGGEYEILFNGVELERYRDAGRRPRRRAHDLLLRPPRGAQGPRRAAGCDAAAAGGRHACGSPATGPTPTGFGRPTAGDPADRVAGAPHRRRQDRPAEGRHGVLRAVAARRVVRRRADRGDGRRHGHRGQRRSTATATWPPTTSTAVLVEPGDADAAGRRAEAGACTTTICATASPAPGSRRADDFSMRTLAEHYAASLPRASRPTATSVAGCSSERTSGGGCPVCSDVRPDVCAATRFDRRRRVPPNARRTHDLDRRGDHRRTACSS